MDISGISSSGAYQTTQTKRPQPPENNGEPRVSPDEAKKTISTLSNNFDTIDVDQDGSLSSTELETYANENGLTLPSEGLTSGITQDDLSTIQTKMAEFEESGEKPMGPPPPGGRPPGPPPGMEEESEEDSSSTTVQKSTEESLLEQILQKAEEKKDDKDEEDSESKTISSSFVQAKLNVYQNSYSSATSSALGDSVSA